MESNHGLLNGTVVERWFLDWRTFPVLH